MSEKLLDISQFNLAAFGAKYTFLTVARTYANIKITARVISGDVDPDLYIRIDAAPSISEYDFISNFSGDIEEFTIFNPVAGRYRILVYGFTGEGIVSIIAYGYFGTEQVVDDVIEDVDDIINNEINDDIITVDGEIGNVTITINQDLSFLQDTIESITSEVNETIFRSITDLENAIVNTLNLVGNLQTESIDGFAESIDESLEGVNIEIVESLDEGNILFDNRMSEIGFTINESLDSLENTIEMNLADPLIMKFDELNSNIRAISHNTIDELINSIFERI